MSDIETQSKRASKGLVKKGKSSWAPASLNEFFDKEPGYRYRMVSKDPTNLAKKAREGWETVSAINNAGTVHDAPERINDGKKMTSVQEGHDWILQRIPEETAKERDEYFNNESERRVQGLTAHLKREVGNAPIHGNINISSRRGTQVIE